MNQHWNTRLPQGEALAAVTLVIPTDSPKVQNSLFSPAGTFKTHPTMDVHWKGEPSKGASAPSHAQRPTTAGISSPGLDPGSMVKMM